MRGPRYARLNHEFDRDGLLAAIDGIPRDQFIQIAATRFDKSILPYQFNTGKPFDIAPPEVLDQSTYSIWTGHEKSIIKGSIDTFTHCIFTHVPGHPELLYADNIQNENGKYIRPYIAHRDRAWDWRADLNLEVFRNEFMRLPFEYVLRARAIVLWEGDHLGNVHRDSVPGFTVPWMDEGFGVINLNLLDGGSTLNIKIGEDVVSKNDPCFTFDEAQYHGSTRSDLKRVQLNIVGKFDFDALNRLIDRDTLID